MTDIQNLSKKVILLLDSLKIMYSRDIALFKELFDRLYNHFE
jgi:hypothetical protein